MSDVQEHEMCSMPVIFIQFWSQLREHSAMWNMH